MEFDYHGCAIHYEIEGTAGLPILMLHGFGCNLQLMKGCMEPAFEGREFRRIYVDLPGHGMSGADLALAGSQAICDAMAALVDAVIPGERFAVAGESFGGYIALGLLHARRNLVAGVHLLCPLTVALDAMRPEPTRLMVSDEALLASLSEQERTSFLMNAVCATREIHARFEQELAPGFTQAVPEFMAKVDEAVVLKDDVRGNLMADPFEGPSLIVCGRQDGIVGYRDQAELLPAFPRATFAVIDLAGHNLQIEQRELHVALVRDWLDRMQKQETLAEGPRCQERF